MLRGLGSEKLLRVVVHLIFECCRQYHCGTTQILPSSWINLCTKVMELAVRCIQIYITSSTILRVHTGSHGRRCLQQT